jgi:CheY-like chemotaxis protein
MPGIDGLGLLQHVMENYPDIPVIMMTAYSTSEMERLARKGGAVGYIAKPFMFENLAKKIMATLRQESEGGTLHSVTSGIFLQLMEMEQKTCTIRLEDRTSGKKGVLFFKHGELFDARLNNLQGKQAAYEIFTWDKVTISIQNHCPSIENKIQSELQPLILDATRMKDEATPADPSPRVDVAEGIDEEPVVAEIKTSNPSQRIKHAIEKRIGQDAGIADIYQDKSWDGIIGQFSNLGDLFGIGALKVFFIDRGEPLDSIIIPGRRTTVISVNPKSPRDKIMSALSQ